MMPGRRAKSDFSGDDPVTFNCAKCKTPLDVLSDTTNNPQDRLAGLCPKCGHVEHDIFTMIATGDGYDTPDIIDYLLSMEKQQRAHVTELRASLAREESKNTDLVRKFNEDGKKIAEKDKLIAGYRELEEQSGKRIAALEKQKTEWFDKILAGSKAGYAVAMTMAIREAEDRVAGEKDVKIAELERLNLVMSKDWGETNTEWERRILAVRADLAVTRSELAECRESRNGYETRIVGLNERDAKLSALIEEIILWYADPSCSKEKKKNLYTRYLKLVKGDDETVLKLLKETEAKGTEP
jgi:hypothetical protein